MNIGDSQRIDNPGTLSSTHLLPKDEGRDKSIRLSQILEVSLRVAEVALVVLVTLGAIGIIGTASLILSSAVLGSLLLAECAKSKLPLQAKRVISWIKATSLEMLTLPIFIPTYFIRLEKNNPDMRDLKEKKPLVIAAHGYLHNSSAWIYGKRRLQNAGLPFVTLTKSSLFGSIDRYAEQIQALSGKYFEYIKENGVVLLGHSMGGVATCKAAVLMQKNPEIKNKIQVITLGSPLQGTGLAKIGIGQCAREMQSNSPYLNELNEEITKAEETVDFHHFGSEVDCIVPHRSSTRSSSEGNHKTYTLDELGHLGLLLSDRVYDQIINTIDSQKLIQP